MANWTRSTLLKRFVEVVADEFDVPADDVLSGEALENISGRELLEVLKAAVIREAMG